MTIKAKMMNLKKSKEEKRKFEEKGRRRSAEIVGVAGKCRGVTVGSDKA